MLIKWGATDGSVGAKPLKLVWATRTLSGVVLPVGLVGSFVKAAGRPCHVILTQIAGLSFIDHVKMAKTSILNEKHALTFCYTSYIFQLVNLELFVMASTLQLSKVDVDNLKIFVA